MHRFMAAVPSTTILYRLLDANHSYFSCGVSPDNSLHFFRSADDPRLPWPGVLFGLTIVSIWYWCTDQVCTDYIHDVLLLLDFKTKCIIINGFQFLESININSVILVIQDDREHA